MDGRPPLQRPAPRPAGAEPLEVEVRDGAGLHVRPAAHEREEAPAATISLRQDSTLAHPSARLHMPHGAERVLVAGDRHAVALLHTARGPTAHRACPAADPGLMSRQGRDG